MANIEIRTIDGSGNQPEDHGRANDELIRLFDPTYEDGINEPRGGGIDQPLTLPNTRDISNIISPQGDITGNPLNASDWLWQWGQFLDHDLGLSEASPDGEVFNIPLQPGDILYGENFTSIPFTRVPAVEGTGEGEVPRIPENELTSFIDGSNGYGSTIDVAAAKRSDLGNSFFGIAAEEFDVPLPPEGQSPYNGKLIIANNNYGTNGELHDPPGGDPNNLSGEIIAPYNRHGSPNADPIGIPDETEFISGDVRSNEQPGLTSIHTLLLREHNLIADKVAFHLDAGDDEALNQAYIQFRDEYVPSLGLDFEPTEQQIRGEFIYEASRAIIGAKSQVITYKEFLPLLIGNEGAEDLEVLDPERLDPRLSVEFSGAAFRLGHTLISDQLRTIDNDGLEEITLSDAFFNPSLISEGGVDKFLIGLNYQESNDIDNRVIDSVRNALFGPPGSGGQDLVAINLQRGRDLGIPSYVEVYESLFPDATPIETFDDLIPLFGEEVTALFAEAYDNVDQIDLWLGGIAEIAGDHGGLLGPTFSAIIEDQFARLRDYDRFFYTDQLADPESFLSIVANAVDIDVENIRLADIIRNHVGNPELVPDDAFTIPFDNEIFGTEADEQLTGTIQNDLINGQAGNDNILGNVGDDILFGGAGNDTVSGQAGNDTLFGGQGTDILDGGIGDDVYEVGVATGGGTVIRDASGSDGLYLDAEITFAAPSEGIIGLERQEADLIIDLDGNGILEPNNDLVITDFFSPAEIIPGSGFIETVGNLSGSDIVEAYSNSNFELPSVQELLNEPLDYLPQIRDFDGNDLGAPEAWQSIGSVDIQGNGAIEQVYVNPELGRWATVGVDITGRIDFSNYGQAGDTRVVGIYIDPQIEAGIVEPGSPFDSQQRFQNDLFNNNLTLLDGDDYDGDGLQEIYFRVNDGTAVLHAYMHADGNIQYANYQSEADLALFMNSNEVDAAIWSDWL